MKLASIEKILSVTAHPNADKLDIAKVLGYQVIVQRGVWKVGDLCIFIQPDSILPEKPWAEFYRARCSRVRGIKIRGEWSMGIIEGTSILSSEHSPQLLSAMNMEGFDVSGILGLVKYEPPQPQDLAAIGNLPMGLFETDEERYQNLEQLPYGEECDVTLKIDGSSMTVYCIRGDGDGWKTGVTSRKMDLKPDVENNYTRMEKKYDLMNRLKAYCMRHNVALAIRGEVHGQGVQTNVNNPHSKGPVEFSVFSVWNFDRMKYEGWADEHYYAKLAKELCFQVVPVIESRVPLTSDMIAQYDSQIDTLNGQPFEGVVLKFRDGRSFKIINKPYDSKKQ